MFISVLYMFRAVMCPSSGELLYQCDTWFMSLWNGNQISHWYNNSPDDGHMAARKKHVQYRNKHVRKKLCVMLVVHKDRTRMHGQQNIKKQMAVIPVCCWIQCVMWLNCCPIVCPAALQQHLVFQPSAFEGTWNPKEKDVLSEMW